jgi:hypothetical protein
MKFAEKIEQTSRVAPTARPGPRNEVGGRTAPDRGPTVPTVLISRPLAWFRPPSEVVLVLVGLVLAAASAATALSAAASAQSDEYTPGFEYTSEETTVAGEGVAESTGAEETVTGESSYPPTSPETASEPTAAPVEQYYGPPLEDTLADTGGMEPWIATSAAGLALLVFACLIYRSRRPHRSDPSHDQLELPEGGRR